MIGRGMDPKPLVMDFCKPQCIYWKEKLERCETKLEMVIKTNPTKTCLYPMRDWVTCVEACVSCLVCGAPGPWLVCCFLQAQPKVHNVLEGTQMNFNKTLWRISTPVQARLHLRLGRLVKSVEWASAAQYWIGWRSSHIYKLGVWEQSYIRPGLSQGGGRPCQQWPALVKA